MSRCETKNSSPLTAIITDLCIPGGLRATFSMKTLQYITPLLINMPTEICLNATYELSQWD